MKKLIVLTGPTAVGKTEVSVLPAKEIGGEIISGDSMQVYRGMDIGTAKVTKEEMMGVPHYMIDIIDPWENFDAFTFKEMATPIIDDIHSRNKIPLIVGGTGFYLQALCYDINFSSNPDFEYRKQLEQIAETKGDDYLYNMLMDVDSEYCKITHKNNRKRIIRALEFFKVEGYPLSKHNETERDRKSPYDLSYFVLTRNRDEIYENIDKRVDTMVKKGLVDEARRIYDMNLSPDCTALKGIGYRELFPYFSGEYDLDTAIYKIKLNSRHYAKRQLTWFKREKNVTFIDRNIYNSNNEIIEFIKENIKYE